MSQPYPPALPNTSTSPTRSRATLGAGQRVRPRLDRQHRERVAVPPRRRQPEVD
jgi:hypothetical protein